MKQSVIIILLSIISFSNYAQSNTINEKETANPNIRETFEVFENDLIMISESSSKWSIKYAQKVSYDVVKLAEAKYLKSVDIILLDLEDKPIMATKYIVGLNDKSLKGKGNEKNNWLTTKDSNLAVVLNYSLSWHKLTRKNKKEFMKKHNFKIGWITSYINTTYSHLTKVSKITDSINSYKLSKTNFN